MQRAREGFFALIGLPERAIFEVSKWLQKKVAPEAGWWDGTWKTMLINFLIHTLILILVVIPFGIVGGIVFTLGGFVSFFSMIGYFS